MGQESSQAGRNGDAREAGAESPEALASASVYQCSCRYLTPSTRLRALQSPTPTGGGLAREKKASESHSERHHPGCLDPMSALVVLLPGGLGSVLFLSQKFLSHPTLGPAEGIRTLQQKGLAYTPHEPIAVQGVHVYLSNDDEPFAYLPSVVF